MPIMILQIVRDLKNKISDMEREILEKKLKLCETRTAMRILIVEHRQMIYRRNAGEIFDLLMRDMNQLGAEISQMKWTKGEMRWEKILSQKSGSRLLRKSARRRH